MATDGVPELFLTQEQAIGEMKLLWLLKSRQFPKCSFEVESGVLIPSMRSSDGLDWTELGDEVWRLSVAAHSKDKIHACGSFVEYIEAKVGIGFRQ